MGCVVQAGALLGVDAVSVQVEVELLRRLPNMVIVGLADSAVKEASERVRSALQSVGCEFPKSRVVVNLSPADLPEVGHALRPADRRRPSRGVAPGAEGPTRRHAARR